MERTSEKEQSLSQNLTQARSIHAPDVLDGQPHERPSAFDGLLSPVRRLRTVELLQVHWIGHENDLIVLRSIP